MNAILFACVIAAVTIGLYYLVSALGRPRVETSPTPEPAKSSTAKSPRCKNGHLFTPGNTYTYPNSNRRYCRICDMVRREAKRKAANSG